MSEFIVNLENPKEDQQSAFVSNKNGVANEKELGETRTVGKKSRFKKILKITGITLAILILVAGVSAYFYWQHLKTTPQYSLALLVDGARRNDQAAMDEVVDTDAVIDSFLPQVTDKAIELYGRGLPPTVVAKIAQAAAPMVGDIKKIAREQLPRVVREKTDKFENVPYWMIAIGAGQVLDIRIEGDLAYIKSNIPEREIELTMKRNGDKWRIIAIKDEKLAKQIAEKVGQQIIATASKGGNVKINGKTVKTDDLQKQLNDILGK